MTETIELYEIATIKGGKRLPKGELLTSRETPYPYIRSTDISKGKIEEGSILFVPENIQQSISRYIVNKGDVILSIVGTLGLCALIPASLHKANLTENCVKITNVSEDYLPEFIYYYLLSPIGQKEIHIRNVGSTQPKLPLYNIRELPIPLMEREKQERIVNSLSLLDSKIDLLHQQNETLEALGAAVFRKWFLGGDWQENSLYNQIELVGGGTPKTDIDGYWGGEIGWLSGGDIASNHKGYVSGASKTVTKEGVANSSAKLLPKSATIISARGTVGKYCLLAEPMTFSQSNYGVMPADGTSFYFTYLLIDHAVDRLLSAAYGSVFDTITTRTFKNLKLPTPPAMEIHKFEQKVSPFFEKMATNTKSINNLIETRDLLLPKLMSGKVKIAQ